MSDLLFLTCDDLYTCLFFFKQKTAYEMLISDGSSDVCSSDLSLRGPASSRAALLCQQHHAGDDHGAAQHPRGRSFFLKYEKAGHRGEIGRASCRERGCQYV